MNPRIMVLRRDVGAGFLVAVATLIYCLTYASLVASGPIAALLPTIFASTLLSTAVMSVVLARWHSLPSAAGGPVGTAAAVVGVTLALVVAHDRSGAIRSADVATVLSLSALLPGLALLVLWRFRLGRAIRYVPYPVVAGFLASTGWLLVSGAFRLSGGVGPLLEATVFLVLLRLAQARWKSPLVIPVAVFGGTVATYAALALARMPLAAARDAHWLYERYPAAGPAFITPAALRFADYGAIGNAWSAFAWVVIVVVSLSMLNGATLELETGGDADVDGDLCVLGAANVAVALSGGFGSQLVLPTSLVAAKLAPRSRVPGFVVASIAALGAFAGGPLVPYLPRPLFMAVLAFIGVRFLEQYVWDGSRAMRRVDVAVVVAMVACTALAGLQAALVLGLVCACLTFVSNASGAQVVRRELTLRVVRSRVERSAVERQILDERGNAVHVVLLQGHLFFGSANALYEALEPVVESQPRCAAIVLDFALVTGIDVSAALSLEKLARKAKRYGISLYFADVGVVFERELRRSGVVKGDAAMYAHLDEALEACEASLLQQFSAVEDGAASDASSVNANDGERRGVLVAGNADDSRRDPLHAYVERRECADADVLFSVGDRSDALYVLVRGTLSVQRDGVHLRTLGPGALVGEMGFFTGDLRSATVVAAGPVTVERLSKDALYRIEREEPQLLAALHARIVRLQADRLRSANTEILTLHV